MPRIAQYPSESMAKYKNGHWPEDAEFKTGTCFMLKRNLHLA